MLKCFVKWDVILFNVYNVWRQAYIIAAYQDIGHISFVLRNIKVMVISYLETSCRCIFRGNFPFRISSPEENKPVKQVKPTVNSLESSELLLGSRHGNVWIWYYYFVIFTCNFFKVFEVNVISVNRGGHFLRIVLLLDPNLIGGWKLALAAS